MVYLLIPVMLVVAFALAWTWWSGRLDRRPASSIDGFHRALDAMQPSTEEPTSDHGRDRRTTRVR